MFYYYIIKHTDFKTPFMVFAGTVTAAINKVMQYLADDGIYTEEGIESIERVDFDGIIIK